MNFKAIFLLLLITPNSTLYCSPLDDHRKAYFKFEAAALDYIHKRTLLKKPDEAIKALQATVLDWEKTASAIRHKSSEKKAITFKTGLNNEKILEATLQTIFDEYNYIYLKKPRPT